MGRLRTFGVDPPGWMVWKRGPEGVGCLCPVVWAPVERLLGPERPQRAVNLRSSRS